MEYPFCPFMGSPCSERCALSIGGECAFSNIASTLSEISEEIGSLASRAQSEIEPNTHLEKNHE